MRFSLPKSKPYKALFRTAVVITLILFIPVIFVNNIKNKKAPFEDEFPVTVDFVNKTIIEDEEVNMYLESDESPLQANALSSIHPKIKEFSTSALIAFTNFAAKYNLAAVVSGQRVVKVYPGQRKEEIANSFTRTLAWTPQEKKEFLTTPKNKSLPLPEGSLYPDTYVVTMNATPYEVQDLISETFEENVLSRYGTSTREKVPLDVALNVASLIQRETIGTRDMRLVSGIIWNRMFTNMPLQLDATLQYVKASRQQTRNWWPKVLSSDKFIKSPYNTYQNPGLPPTPIANPSVAAIIAALNPIKTDCYFYFHDNKGDMHCSPTYEGHVALLRKMYGRGK